MNTPGERKLPVGHGLFDPLTGDLSLEGRTVRLRPRTAALLAYLVQHGDRPVGKDELMQTLWPNVVVTEDSIVQCVKEIRQALGDSGREWIRTLPRTGYAFVGNPASEPAPPQGFRFDRRWRWAAALVLAAGLAGAVGGHFWPAPPLDASLRVLVLPIENETGDAAHDRTADNLTEEITDKFGRARGTVIAPSTARAFKGKPVDLSALGKQLDVRYVVQGSLRMDEERPVLRLRLADAGSSVQVWQQVFKFNPGIPELRPEILGGIWARLTEQMLLAETRRSGNADAQKAAELYVRANDVVRSPGSEGEKSAQAIALLEEAVRLKTDLGAAWAMLAAMYLGDGRFTAARAERLARAGRAIDRARKILPNDDAIIGWQAMVYVEQGRAAEALNLSERALEVNPVNAMAMMVRADALRIMGRPQDALAQVEKALRTSPRDPTLPLMYMEAGLIHLELADDAAAAEALRRAAKGAPKHPVVLLHAAGVLGAAGRIDEARADMAQLLQLRPGFTLTRLRANEPSQDARFVEGRQRFYDGLRRAGLPE